MMQVQRKVAYLNNIMFRIVSSSNTHKLKVNKYNEKHEKQTIRLFEMSHKAKNQIFNDSYGRQYDGILLIPLYFGSVIS